MSQAKNQPHGGMGPGPKHGPGGPRHMMGGKPKESRATIKRLLEYMGKDKMLVVLALVFVLVFSGATLAGSYMLKPIVDQLGKTALQVASLKNKNLDFSTVLADGTWTLLKGVLTMLVIYGVGVLANYLQQRIMIGVSQRALIRIRKDLFDHFDCKEEGALIRKAVDASLDENVRTPEIQVADGAKYGTKEVGQWIVDYIKKA